MKIEYDGKFTVTYETDSGERSGFRVAPEVGQLIAAAPNLLAALNVAKEAIRAWHGEGCWDIYNRESPEMKLINAAIAKAEGQS